MKILKNLFSLLSRNEIGYAALLLILIVIMALLEMIGVASILPFISVLSDPNIIETNIYLKFIFQKLKLFGYHTKQEFLFLLGIFVFLTLIISLSFKALTTYVQIRFVYMQEYNIAKRLFESYLKQPYAWFLSRNSSDLVKNLTSEVQQIALSGLGPIVELISKGFIIFAIIILLILVDPKTALISGFLLALTYSMIFFLIRKYISSLGLNRLKNNQLRFKTLSEGLGGVKEVKLGGHENFFLNLFSRAAQNYAKTQASSFVIGLLPRYILEALAFGGILILILLNIFQGSNFKDLLPILSLYVFAGYRLLPAFQQVYVSFTQLTFIKSSVDKISKDLKTINLINSNLTQEKINFSKNISLKKVFFNYPNSKHYALKDINLNIPAKSKVGIIGPTGSGKTTLIDIILGILTPSKGTLEVDGKVINNHNYRSWYTNIGYVPQNIFLSDDTIASNIAFGMDKKKIDMKQVIKVAKIAKLHDFINSDLPENYQTLIGERGVRLSGGQIQRIAIARALYHDPKILILDEATSSLDNFTEFDVMQSIDNLSKEITVIMIAHRLNTVKNCDIIFKIEKSYLTGYGSFEEIIKKQNLKKYLI